MLPRAQSTKPRDDDARWTAVLARDASCDGAFYYSVASTGVFCLPSCPARRPKRDNVRFHASIAEAAAAGFRPCKRCRPDAPSLDARRAEKIATARGLIDTSEEAPRLADLAARVELSPHHFHRLFKATVGVTPKAYAVAARRERVRGQLKDSSSVTEAIHAAGYGSSSRFYAEADQTLGMTPIAYRSGGAGEEICFAVTSCSLGRVLVAATAKGVCAIFFGDEDEPLERDLRHRFPKANIVEGGDEFALLVSTTVQVIEAKRDIADVPLDIRGTAFQQRVWAAMREIPAGATTSYAQLAQKIGAPKSVRAVAGACAANKLAVIIPCHRVVCADGAISGYRWGVERKRRLLEQEAPAVVKDTEPDDA
jgi:AraC family transcriptional regulator of adaptative response/methylated-DNA-[protein]-cysteine methyltransferase